MGRRVALDNLRKLFSPQCRYSKTTGPAIGLVWVIPLYAVRL